MAAHWVFFSNHWYVLLLIARDSSARLRDIAGGVGITERATQAIVKDLAGAGYVTVHKDGRRNRYALNRQARLRHPLVAATTVGAVIDAIAVPPRAGSGGP